MVFPPWLPSCSVAKGWVDGSTFSSISHLSSSRYCQPQHRGLVLDINIGCSTKWLCDRLAALFLSMLRKTATAVQVGAHAKRLGDDGSPRAQREVIHNQKVAALPWDCVLENIFSNAVTTRTLIHSWHWQVQTFRQFFKSRHGWQKEHWGYWQPFASRGTLVATVIASIFGPEEARP